MVKKLMKETSDMYLDTFLSSIHTSRFHADQEQRGCLKVKKMAKGCCGHVLIWRETKPFFYCSGAVWQYFQHFHEASSSAQVTPALRGVKILQPANRQTAKLV